MERRARDTRKAASWEESVGSYRSAWGRARGRWRMEAQSCGLHCGVHNLQGCLYCDPLQSTSGAYAGAPGYPNS